MASAETSLASPIPPSLCGLCVSARGDGVRAETQRPQSRLLLSRSGVLVGFVDVLRPKGYRRLSGDAPVFFRVQRGRAAAAVANRFSGQEDIRHLALGRGKERLRGRIEVQIAAKIHEQQTVVAIRGEEAKNESLRSQDGAVDSARPLGPEYRILTPQTQEVA